MNKKYLTLAGRIENELDESIPEGASWHKDLLKQMTIKIKNVRPALLSKESEKKLDEYRGFRHIVRNVYSYNFSPEKILLLMDKLEEINIQIIREMKVLINFLEQAGEA